MSWGAVIAGGAAIVGGVIGSKGAKSAANKQVGANKMAIQEQQRQFDLTRGDYMPWINTGRNALNRLDQASTGDMSQFYASPDYNFRRTEGTRDIGNVFAAKGGGGNAMRALAQFNSNLASGEYGSWWNRQAGLANVGQTAVQGSAIAGANAANQIGGYYGNIGNARAAGTYGSAEAINNALVSGLSNYLYSRPQSGTVSEIPKSKYAPTQRRYFP